MAKSWCGASFELIYKLKLNGISRGWTRDGDLFSQTSTASLGVQLIGI
jgi:hypothetical protein